MKNLVLIDFTDESLHALTYATAFTKLMNGSLEIINVSEPAQRAAAREHLIELQYKFSSTDFTIEINDLVGEMESELPEYINQDKVGFVFCGTHELRILEPFFSSRALNLMNNANANFVFIPKNLTEFHPIKQVIVPVFSDKHSIQNIEALRYLNQFMPFTTKLITAKSDEKDLLENMVVATKLLDQAGLAYSTEFIGRTEDEMRDGLSDTANLLSSDLISIVNLTEVNLFNYGAKGFVENLIRNDHGIPVLVIQGKEVEHYSSFHTSGGY